MENETIILSLGGSLICPEKIDVEFLKKFRELILSQVKIGKRFVIITGGGRICREYNNALKEIAKPTDEDLDWLGISVTKVNAQLVKQMFRSLTHPEVIENPNLKIDFKEKILVAGGWKPGFSTDMDAVILAKQFEIKKIINMTNIDYVHDKDPKLFPNAKKIEKISWKDYLKLFGEKWIPGLNAPFDPIASIECEKNKVTVYVTNGRKLDNLLKIIENKPAEGTIIN